MCVYTCTAACMSFRSNLNSLGTSNIYFIIPGRKVENAGVVAVHDKLLAISLDLVKRQYHKTTKYLYLSLRLTGLWKCKI